MVLGTFTEYMVTRRQNQQDTKEVHGKMEENRSDVENNNGKKSSFDIKNKQNVYKVTEKEIQEIEKKLKNRKSLDDPLAEKQKEPSQSKLLLVI